MNCIYMSQSAAIQSIFSLSPAFSRTHTAFVFVPNSVHHHLPKMQIIRIIHKQTLLDGAI